MFLLFSGSKYYPSKAWEDFKGSFGSMEATLRKIAKDRDEWWQIVDATTLQIVDQFEEDWDR